jgi:UTP--glucose-1-phosphate uridylyltransferase
MSDPRTAALGLADADRTLLDRHGFDHATFERLRTELARGAFPSSRNAVDAVVAPPGEDDLTALPPAGTAAAAALEERGRAALDRGEVAAVVLNGGMATRFGGVVKGVVEVFDGQSFLGLKLEDVARAHASAPVFLMNSFATDADTRAHLEKRGWFGLGAGRVHCFTQGISIRLTPEGEVFRDARGQVSFYAPGHGDLFPCLARAPGFRRFVEQGGRYILVSNVDNVGATLSAHVIGAHLAGGREVTVEVAARAPGDKGGAPARLRGRVEVLEGFRFPPSFDIERIPVFNTNTMVVDVRAVREDYPLTWFRADKTVDGRPAVQFERLMGEVTAFRDATYLVVPREGADGRFLPVKTPEDLVTLRPALRARTGH